MNTEELLKPRYKVIADYPGSGYDVGKILHPELYRYDDIGDLDKFPHLFRKLEWWEEREIEDMPEYIKSHLGVFKVKWIIRELDNNLYLTDANDENDTWIKPSDKTVPATEQEYESFINNN